MKSKEFENNTQAHHQLHNDVGFVNELSEEMGVGQADAERIIMTQGLKGLDNLCMEDDEAEEIEVILGDKATTSDDCKPSSESSYSDDEIDRMFNFAK